MTSTRSQGTPLGTTSQPGSGRRLQMARPNRSVLNTEAPPQVRGACRSPRLR